MFRCCGLGSNVFCGNLNYDPALLDTGWRPLRLLRNIKQSKATEPADKTAID